MGSKAEYEERKRLRDEKIKARDTLEHDRSDIEFIDVLDRMATAFERIADAMEAPNKIWEPSKHE